MQIYYEEIKELAHKLNLNINNRGVHLAIFDADTIAEIKAGNKDYETRWANVRNRPFNVVKNGDYVFIKESNGPVCAFYIAEKIKFYSNLDNADYEELSALLNEPIDQLKKYKNKYVTLMEMKNIKFIEKVMIHKRDCQTWAVVK